MKSKTSHQSNENFVVQTQFTAMLSVVDKIQNFHDKSLHRHELRAIVDDAALAVGCDLAEGAFDPHADLSLFRIGVSAPWWGIPREL